MNNLLSVLSLGSRWALTVEYEGFDFYLTIDIAGVTLDCDGAFIFGECNEEIHIPPSADVIQDMDGSFVITMKDTKFKMTLEEISVND